MKDDKQSKDGVSVYGEGTVVNLNPQPEMHLKNASGAVEKALPVAYCFGPRFADKTLVLMVPESKADEVAEKINEIFATGAIML